MDEVFASLLAAYRSEDWAAVRARWDTFDAELRAHMDLEERSVLPAFAAIDPAEAAALQAEHDTLRTQLAELGVRVELHAVAIDEIDALIRTLRSHAARENGLLYPWLTRSAPTAGR